MKLRKAFHWISLIMAILLVVFVGYNWLTAPNNEIRIIYFTILCGTIFPLVQLIDSIGLFGKKTEEYALLDKKLEEIYSPIHAMVVAINNKIPREEALKLTVGIRLSSSLIEVAKLSTIFRKYAHVLGNDHLKKWLKIEDQMDHPSGFWFGGDEQKWLDELEVEYQKLVKELDKHKP